MKWHSDNRFSQAIPIKEMRWEFFHTLLTILFFHTDAQPNSESGIGRVTPSRLVSLIRIVCVHRYIGILSFHLASPRNRFLNCNDRLLVYLHYQFQLRRSDEKVFVFSHIADNSFLSFWCDHKTQCNGESGIRRG